MRPELLELGGEYHFVEYQKQFDALFHSGIVTDVLGNRVIFGPTSCRHVCFTKEHEEKKNLNAARIRWDQKRADRIQWILEALKTPKRIRPAKGNAWAYMLEVIEDKERNLTPELYDVIVNNITTTAHMPYGIVGTVHFTTAHSIFAIQWDELSKTYPWIYPDYRVSPLPKK